MPATLLIRDETTSGETRQRMTLHFDSAEITVRELIEARVRDEVARYNAATPGFFNGLVQPDSAESGADGWRLREGRKIDAEAQCRLALQAFERNGYFLLVGDRQATSLDERLLLDEVAEVSFVKLVPLVGG